MRRFQTTPISDSTTVCSSTLFRRLPALIDARLGKCYQNSGEEGTVDGYQSRQHGSDQEHNQAGVQPCANRLTDGSLVRCPARWCCMETSHCFEGLFFATSLEARIHNGVLLFRRLVSILSTATSRQGAGLLVQPARGHRVPTRSAARPDC